SSRPLETIMANVAIPIITSEIDRGHLSPTDISQFIRLEQCERYLHLRLHEKTVGQKFMYDYGVTPQSLPPMLTLSGGEFEKQIEKMIASKYSKFNFATD